MNIEIILEPDKERHRRSELITAFAPTKIASEFDVLEGGES